MGGGCASLRVDASGADIEFGIQPDKELQFSQEKSQLGYDTMIEDAVMYLRDRFENFKRTRRWEK